jgi:PRC-barrel domain
MEAEMFRKLVLASAMATSFGLNAYAQQPSRDPTDQQPRAGQRAEVVQSQGEHLFTSLRQQPVYSAENTNTGIGEIYDLLIEPSGSVKAVIVDVGRGTSRTRLAIPISQFDIQPQRATGAENRSVRVILKTSPEQLASLPVFVPFDPNVAR